MSWGTLTGLALAVLVAGCAAPTGGSRPSSGQSQTRCLSQPGRGENYSPNRPLVMFLCIES